MQRLTRREVLHLSILAAGGSILASCAPATQTPQAATGEPQVEGPTVVPATVAPAKQVALQYYIGFGSGGEPEKVAAVKKMFERFAEANPGLTAEAVVVPAANEEAKNKFKAMVAAGSPPDVLTLGMAAWDMAVRGAFVDMRDLLDRDKIDTSEWEKAAFDSYTVAPKGNLLYGLPFGLNACLCVYNKTLWDAAGAAMVKSWDDASWTWDTMLEGAKKVTKGSGDNIDTFGMLRFCGEEQAPWMFGGNYCTDDLSRIDINTPESIQGFDFAQAEVYTHHVAPTDAESQALTNGFLSGKVGIYYEGTWAVFTLLEIKDFEWDFAPVPFGGKLTVDQGRATPYWPDSLAISSKQNIEESWKLVKFLLLDDANYKEFTTFMSMIPARRSFRDAYYQAWADKAPKVNWSIVKDMWRWTRIANDLLNANWLETYNVLAQGVQPIWTGEAKAKDVIPDVAARMDEVWQQGIQTVKQLTGS